MNSSPPLVIVSGPSGSGKSTVIARLLARPDLQLRLSVSATTRSPRAGEADGVHYHFWTRERFEEVKKRDGFLEWAEVYGNCYGTLKSELEQARSAGKVPLLDIDVQGAAQVRRQCADNVSVFLTAPSLEAYEQRLRHRHTESEAAMQRRLAGVRNELARAGEYDYRVVNDDLERTVDEVAVIIRRHVGGK